jgi:hypothetical protein
MEETQIVYLVGGILISLVIQYKIIMSATATTKKLFQLRRQTFLLEQIALKNGVPQQDIDRQLKALKDEFGMKG